jgi:hypothetical protein
VLDIDPISIQRVAPLQPENKQGVGKLFHVLARFALVETNRNIEPLTRPPVGFALKDLGVTLVGFIE